MKLLQELQPIRPSCLLGKVAVMLSAHKFGNEVKRAYGGATRSTKPQAHGAMIFGLKATGDLPLS